MSGNGPDPYADPYPAWQQPPYQEQPYQEQPPYTEPYGHPYQEEQPYAEPYAEPYQGQQYVGSYQQQYAAAAYQQQPQPGSYATTYGDFYEEEAQEAPQAPDDDVLTEPAPSGLRHGRALTPATPAPQPVTVEVQTAEERDAEELRTARGGLPTWAVVLLPALVTLVLGGYGLGKRQVGQEESASWWAASHSWSDLARLLDHTDVLLAPYYVLLHAWVSVAGTSPTALRLPSLLAMAAAAGTLGVLGRRMFDAPTGLVAGVVFAVLPVTSHYAQDARPYAMATFGALVACVMLYRALDHKGADRWGGYALALLVTGLFHVVTVVVVLAFLVLVRVSARDRLGAWASVTAVCVVPMIAFAMLGRGQNGQASTHGTDLSALKHFPQQVIGSAHGAAALGVLALLGIVFARRNALPLLVWAVVPPVLLFALRNVSKLFDPAYFLFTVPAWALLAAAALCGLVRLLPGRPAGLAVRQLAFGAMVTAALVAVVLPDLKAVRVPLAQGQPDFAAAARWLASAQKPGDGITYTGTVGQPLRTMGYALRDDASAPRDAFLSQTPEQAGTYTGVPCLAPAVCAKGLSRIWLLSTEKPAAVYTGMSAPQVSLLKLSYRTASQKTFPGGITLVLLVRTSAV